MALDKTIEKLDDCLRDCPAGHNNLSGRLTAIRESLVCLQKNLAQPSAWQIRFLNRDEGWCECGEDVFNSVRQTGEFGMGRAEARALYAIEWSDYEQKFIKPD